MAGFDNKSLTLIGESRQADQSVIRKFFYATADATATVKAAGYFNGGRDRLTVGDIVEVSAGIGGTPVTLHMRLTAVPGSGNVTATNVVDVT